MIGLKFKDKHSYIDMGLFMRSDNRTVLLNFANMNLKSRENMAQRDYGGNTYAKRIITVNILCCQNRQ